MNIREIPPANPANEKGKRTFEIKFRNGHQITYCLRKAREEVGKHFHKGSDPSKNPEVSILLSGTIHLFLCYPNGHKQERVITANLGPTIIEIEPLVGHTFICLTDCVFVEYRVTHFDPAHTDCYPLSELPQTQPA